MVKNALGHKFHWAVADYLQRAARHIASKTDVRQAYELGKRAVELALKGHNAVMPTIERTSDVPYRYRIGVADLADVANVEKFMPRDFISADGFSHHREVPALPAPADRRRGLPGVPRRPAGLRDAEERRRSRRSLAAVRAAVKPAPLECAPRAAAIRLPPRRRRSSVGRAAHS